MDRLRSGLRTISEDQRILDVFAKDRPIYTSDPKDCTVSGIRESVRKLSQNHPVRLVVVDYLQLIGGSDQEEGKTATVTDEIILGFKALARELNLSVLVLSQLTDTPKRSRLRRPHIPTSPEAPELQNTRM